MPKVEKRQRTRIDTLNLLSFIVHDNAGTQLYERLGRTLNVSETGILLETDIPVDAHLGVDVKIGLDEELVDIQGTIIHVNVNAQQRYEIGIKFSKIDDRDLKILKAYIEAFSKI
jgi:hypothetical protein